MRYRIAVTVSDNINGESRCRMFFSKWTDDRTEWENLREKMKKNVMDYFLGITDGFTFWLEISDSKDTVIVNPVSPTLEAISIHIQEANS